MYTKKGGWYYITYISLNHAYSIDNYAINDRGTQKVVCTFFVHTLGCFIKH